MAWFFGESWDLYAAPIDGLGYWDNTSGTTSAPNLQAGRFAGSRCMSWSATVTTQSYFYKTSGQNDAVHHFSFGYKQAFAAVGGTNNGHFITLYDGAAIQCTVAFNGNGSILVTSGSVSGTVIATYAGAVPSHDVWHHFEIEIVIHNTAGSIKVRRNGNTTEDFTATSLNTRNGSTNAYVNRIGLGCFGAWSNGAYGNTDDFLWRSDPTSVPWWGDIRCYTRMPETDNSVTWTRAGARPSAMSGGSAIAAAVNKTHYVYHYMPAAGLINTVAIYVASATYTGNIKAALYAESLITPLRPGAIIATANNIITPTAIGYHNFTFTGAAVAAGQKVWFGYCLDSATGGSTVFQGGTTAYFSGSTPYASFPVAEPAALSAGSNNVTSVLYLTPQTNAGFVNEPQQDGTTTYLLSSTPGQADLYTIAGISNTPTTNYGVVTRGMYQKSDAGTRIVLMQLKSGGVTVQSPPLALAAGAWQWLTFTNVTDPATGAAWTAAGINGILIGPVLTT